MWYHALLPATWSTTSRNPPSLDLAGSEYEETHDMSGRVEAGPDQRRSGPPCGCCPRRNDRTKNGDISRAVLFTYLRVVHEILVKGIVVGWRVSHVVVVPRGGVYGKGVLVVWRTPFRVPLSRPPKQPQSLWRFIEVFLAFSKLRRCSPRSRSRERGLRFTRSQDRARSSKPSHDWETRDEARGQAIPVDTGRR